MTLRVAGVLLSAALVVALVALILKWAPEWLAKKGLTGKDEAEDIGRVRTALLATLAGVIAIVGAVFTLRRSALRSRQARPRAVTAFPLCRTTAQPSLPPARARRSPRRKESLPPDGA